jgi:lipase
VQLTQVEGLAVRGWRERRPGTPVVLALHGLTSTSAVWSDLAGRLEAPVIAPDLPGRGFSKDSPARPGLSGLAAAVLRSADALGLDDVVVVGHSMGAFLAPLVVHGLGERVRGVVLLDGGVSPDPSPLVRPLAVRALFGLQMARLQRTFPDVDSYSRAAEGNWSANRPELAGALRAWSESILQPGPKGLRPNLSARRIVGDAVDSLTRPPHLALLRNADVPVHLIAAAHGADDTKPAFLSENAIAAGSRVVPRVTWERVAANHATMLFDPAAAAAVQELLIRR